MTMPITAPNQGENLIIQYIINKLQPDDVVLRLFVNDVVITETTVAADLTESTDPAYSSITLAGATWTISQVGGETVATYPDQIFNFDDAETIYGYYISDQANGHILWGERFPAAPFNIPSSGGTLTLTPKLSLS
jgi:hypothetical protein